MPALLTRMSNRPHLPVTASITSSTLALFATSQAMTSAVPPAARMASAVSVSLSRLRATQATLAPAPASTSAIALPIPCEAPVTIATWSVKLT